MTGVTHNSDIQPKLLLVLVVLKAAILASGSNRPVPILLGRTELQPERPER